MGRRWTKEKWNKNIGVIRELYSKDPSKIYNSNYYRNQRKGEDYKISNGKVLSETFNLESIIDFGFGIGAYLEGALQAKTKRVLGIDIGYDVAKEFIPEYMRGFIKKGHIGKPLDYGKWDCALSIEVAEHLLPEEEDIFIENMVNASSRLIVLSVGYNFCYFHLNAGKKPKYWANKLVEAGCKLLPEETKKLKTAWADKSRRHIVKKVIVAGVL